MANDFARVAAASVRVHLGDVEANRREIVARMRELEAQGVQVAVFPELCVTGYTLGDLLLHEPVQRAAFAAMKEIAAQTGDMAVIVGLPINQRSRLFNCAAVLQGGRVRGLVPKTYLPNGNEFYETRWFVSGTQAEPAFEQDGVHCPLAPDLLFDFGDFSFAVEICEDLWTPIPPSSQYAVDGADVIVNPSASNALVSKHAYRRELLRQQSGRLYAGYAYACACFGESTSDLVFCGYTGVFENGKALAEGRRFTLTGDAAVADIDVQRLRYQRQRNGSFHQMERREAPMKLVPLPVSGVAQKQPLLRPIAPLPFVPGGAEMEEHLEEIVRIQCTGLMTRLTAIGCRNIVIGVSGGLDSTLALLVGVRAMDGLGLPRAGVHAITMPGMGTGKRTKSNADRLMEVLGVSALEIGIEKAVRQHFVDIGQDEAIHDVTYENSQARERTQILMDYANKVNGIVLGTGDMSEAALGFSTYNGDHMSMYNVNCSVPKTLVKSLVRYLSEHDFDGAVRDVCRDVIDTPISPELLPADKGELTQRTEDILGDYALHDFFLYHMLDSGSGPERLKAFALQAFDGVYDEAKIDAQLDTFLRRFFQQQFKRNCVPDGPKVGSISLSPRGDLRMPSDMSGALWRDALK
ncbi:MAG: NAD(+) synthase [Clostridiales bacterium]|nr:NAD(+) synthase [Clostridiales bacterium]